MKTKQLLSLLTGLMLLLTPLAGLADVADALSSAKMQIVIESPQSHIRQEIEQDLEERFPDVDVVLNYNYSNNMLYSVEQTLAHDLAPDIYLCQVLPNLSVDTLAQNFYDMAAEPFVSNYYLSAIEGCTSANGGLYYLPGPSYVYGIIYDKTMFEQLGLKVPTNYSEFVALCRQVDEMGLVAQEPDPNDKNNWRDVPVRAFVPTMKYMDMFQILFNTLNYESYFRGIRNAKWLSDYQTGTGSLVGRMEPAVEKFLKLFEDGVISQELWTTSPFYRTNKLYNYHTALMTIECQQGFQFNEKYGPSDPEKRHEMGIMPIFTSDEPNSGYMYGIPRSYIGITKMATRQPERLKKVLEIVDYLSTVDGQMQMISGADYFGFLKSGAEFNSPQYAEVMDIINSDRVVTDFYLAGSNSRGRVEQYLHKSMLSLANGEITMEEYLLGADEVRDNVVTPPEPVVHGTVPVTLEPLQTAYVEGLALLHSMDADIGYVQVCPDYGTLQYLFDGDITDDLIRFISPEYSSVSKPIEGHYEYVVVEMTGEELMEHAVRKYGTQVFAMAGVDMVYDSTKSRLEKYVSLTIDGEPMDMSKTYRIASIRGAVPGIETVAEYKELTFYDMFLKYLTEEAGGVINAPEQLTILK